MVLGKLNLKDFKSQTNSFKTYVCVLPNKACTANSETRQKENLTVCLHKENILLLCGNLAEL